MGVRRVFRSGRYVFGPRFAAVAAMRPKVEGATCACLFNFSHARNNTDGIEKTTGEANSSFLRIIRAFYSKDASDVLVAVSVIAKSIVSAVRRIVVVIAVPDLGIVSAPVIVVIIVLIPRRDIAVYPIQRSSVGSRMSVEMGSDSDNARYLRDLAGASSGAASLASRSACISRMGGFPKNRLYSRLNWLALS